MRIRILKILLAMQDVQTTSMEYPQFRLVSDRRYSELLFVTLSCGRGRGWVRGCWSGEDGWRWQRW